jgi:hypothetical protein
MKEKTAMKLKAHPKLWAKVSEASLPMINSESGITFVFREEELGGSQCKVSA